MPVSHQSVLYDVHDAKVYPLTADTGASPTYGPALDVPGIAEVSLDPNLVTAELKGDAQVVARKGRVDRLAVDVTYSKLDLDVLETILGGDTTDPSATEARWEIGGSNSLPYFMLQFKVEDLDVGMGDLHVILFKCQLTDASLLDQSTDEFGQPSFSLEAFPAASNGLIGRVRFLSAKTALTA